MAQFGMGIGRVGEAGIVFKRKFRWTLEIKGACFNIQRHFVRVAARPNLQIQEIELNFLNAKEYIPGKGEWNSIQIQYIDVADQQMTELYSWINTTYEFGGRQSFVNLRQSEKAGWAGEGSLILYDGCGKALEQWTLRKMWPQTVDFGTLDYADHEFVTVDLTVRYTDVSYEGICNPSPRNCCTGC